MSGPDGTAADSGDGDGEGDGNEARAGEYVLGTLNDAEHTAVERALPHDPALRAAVYRWQDDLLTLTLRTRALLPRTPLWRRIEATLWAAPKPQPQSQRWWRLLPLWQGLSAAAVAAAVFMAVLLVQRPEAPATQYLAVLQMPDTHATGWLVELRVDGQLRLRPVGPQPEVPADRALEFWTKPEGAPGPTSLGLVRAGQTLQIPLSRLPAAGERQLFELTLEPATGSPTGRPTGPIVAVGSTVRL